MSPTLRAAIRRRLPAAAVLAAVLAVSFGCGGIPAADKANPRSSPADTAGCVRRDAHVTLTPGQGVPYQLAGWLCQPLVHTDTVQLLLSGFTYSHAYWLGPSAGTSWTAAAVRSGTAVYLVDRIGVGASDRPPAAQVTVESEAAVTHQLAVGLRDGTLGTFTKVVGVGHSYGSIVLAAAAATHHDFDALVLTSKMHQADAGVMTGFHDDLIGADTDTTFAGMTMPDGYVTTPPGSRSGLFLNGADAAIGAAAFDEQTKAAGTTGELATMKTDQEIADSRKITVPVLMMVGTADKLFCNATLHCATGTDLCQRERGNYRTTVDAVTIAGAGHAIDLHANAATAFTIADQWITRTTTGTGPRPDVTRCQP